MRPLLVALVLTSLLSGCTDDTDPGRQTAADCVAGQEFNPHEERCVRASGSDTEVCNAWIDGGDSDAGNLVCQVDSNGEATLDLSLAIGGTAAVQVRDGAGGIVYSQDVGSIEQSLPLGGAEGSWTLQVDFGSAGGTGQIVLWG